jgi:hypothetical protein
VPVVLERAVALRFAIPPAIPFSLLRRAALVHLSADGQVLTHTALFGYLGHPIRRAQGPAIATGLDVVNGADSPSRSHAPEYRRRNRGFLRPSGISRQIDPVTEHFRAAVAGHLPKAFD